MKSHINYHTRHILRTKRCITRIFVLKKRLIHRIVFKVMAQMGNWNRQRARELLAKSGRTREWVASYCGITVRHLGAVLSGRCKPSLSVIKLLASALETSESELLPAA